MTSSDFLCRTVTSLVLFIALWISACDGDECTPDQCNYIAVEQLLDCDNIECTDFPDFSNWTDPVATLTLRGTNISRVTSVQVLCSILERLDLSDNLISDVDHDAFRNCRKLSDIILDRNRLELDLFSDPGRNPVFAMSSLSHLSLASNRIGDVINEPFSGEIQSLHVLNLSDNGIKTIDHKSLTDLLHLESLDLSQNEISEVHWQIFRGLKALVYLDLSRNRLSALPDKLFDDCNNLQELALSQNLISELDVRVFSGLKSLKVLHLDSNLLTLIPATMPPTLQLLSLNLSYNALTSLGEELFQWDSIYEGDLSGNEWNCDCHLEWMRHKLNDSLLHTVVCAEPKHLQGRSLANVDPTIKLSCSFTFRYRRQTALALIAIVSVVFLLSVVLLVVKCRRTVLPWWFDPASDYETLYSANDAEFDSTEGINIIRTPKGTRRSRSAANKCNAPTPV